MIVVYGALLLEKLKIDDPVGAVPVHLMNGIWGTLAIGLFATENGVTGLIAGDSAQLLSQLIGVGAVGVWCVITGYILFFGLLKGLVGLRVSKEEEIEGLDLTEHGNEAYAPDVVPSLDKA